MLKSRYFGPVESPWLLHLKPDRMDRQLPFLFTLVALPYERTSELTTRPEADPKRWSKQPTKPMIDQFSSNMR